MSSTRRLFSNSVIVFVGTIVSSVFSYLFNMLMGRMLGPSMYGDMSAIMSLLAVTSVAGGTILTVTMRYSGELYAVGNFGALRKIFNVFTKYVLIFGGLIFLISIIFAKFITDFLSIHDTMPLIIALVTFITSYTIIVNRGILQGVQNFVSLSAIGVFEMFLRLVLGIALVKFGLGLNGAISAIVLATAAAYFVSLLPIRKLFAKNSSKNEDKGFAFDKKEIISYSGPTFIAMFFLAASLNIDIIMIKHYFSPDQAGQYAAISTIAKIILYVTAPVIGVMFPMISEHRTKGEKHYKLFLYSFLFTILGALTILGVYTVAPSFVINILYGSEYTASFALLPVVGIMIVFYALINLICSYFLAVKNFTFIWFYGGALLLQIALIYFYHGSILEVVRMMIFTLGLLFFMLMSMYLISKKDRIAEFFRGEYEG